MYNPLKFSTLRYFGMSEEATFIEFSYTIDLLSFKQYSLLAKEHLLQIWDHNKRHHEQVKRKSKLIISPSLKFNSMHKYNTT